MSRLLLFQVTYLHVAIITLMFVSVVWGLLSWRRSQFEQWPFLLMAFPPLLLAFSATISIVLLSYEYQHPFIDLANSMSAILLVSCTFILPFAAFLVTRLTRHQRSEHRLEAFLSRARMKTPTAYTPSDIDEAVAIEAITRSFEKAIARGGGPPGFTDSRDR